MKTFVIFYHDTDQYYKQYLNTVLVRQLFDLNTFDIPIYFTIYFTCYFGFLCYDTEMCAIK